MVRIFSKLRKSLLKEGKTARYFKYALGEILLVVIGILLALQVNNWNEWRIERDEEQMVLRQLQDDYRANLAQLDQKIRMRGYILEAAQFVLHAMDRPETNPRDSLLASLSILLIDPTFDPIENDLGIFRDLANFFINDLKMDWALEGTARFDKREIGSSRQPASMAEIASSKELEGVVSAAITYNATANLESEALRKRIMEILSLIEGEIEE